MDASNSLVLYPNDTLVNFGEKVFYKCKEDHYFDEDHDMTDFSVECHSTGHFDPIQNWTFCQTEEGNKGHF